MSSSTTTKHTQAEDRDINWTIFVSGLQHGGRGANLADKNMTDNLAILFDSVTDIDFNFSVDKSNYATEDRATLSDHAVVKDKKISFTGRITSAPQYINPHNFIDRNTDPNNPASSNRPGELLRTLQEIINKRQIVSLVTEEQLFEDFIITSAKASRKAKDGDCLVFDIELTEFRTFQMNKVVDATVFSSPKKVNRTQQKGAVNSAQGNPDNATQATKQAEDSKMEVQSAREYTREKLKKQGKL